jgi:murein L,D-transpeptidase YafK
MKKWLLLTVCCAVLTAVAYYFFPEDKLPGNIKIEKIIVRKADSRLEVYAAGELVKSYTVAIGRNAVGDKEFQGDKRTPEGSYIINGKNPGSTYHKNLGISYPHHADREEAKRKNLNPGGDIKIHGLKNGLGFIGKFHRFFNWTAGCIAVTNAEMDELYDHVPIGTPIIIQP